jgi:hypothetical protein
MSYDNNYCTVAFGNIEQICEFVALAIDWRNDLGDCGTVTRLQWSGCHYAIVSNKAPEGREFEFWDQMIPQFPKLRFLLSRVSERDGYLINIVRHRHDPFGFNSCLLDHTTKQTMGQFPSDKNPILVLDDFHDELLEDQRLRHALTLLGYPIEMLVGCSVSATV